MDVFKAADTLEDGTREAQYGCAIRRGRSRSASIRREDVQQPRDMPQVTLEPVSAFVPPQVSLEPVPVLMLPTYLPAVQHPYQ